MPDCPACEADVDVDAFDVDLGDTVSCPECGEMLEVISLTPVELDLLPGDEADEDEDEDEDEDGHGHGH